MAQQTIGIGTTADDGTGDPIRTAFDKCNDNFDELYTEVADRGWVYYADNQYTSGSPLSVNNDRVKLTNNGNTSTITTYLPTGEDSFWDTATDKIIANSVGDCYDIRLGFKAKSTAANDWFGVELDIGSVIAAESFTFLKGTGIEQRFIFTMPIFCLNTFFTNGAEIYINTATSSDSITVYDIDLFIKRDFKG